MKQSNKSSDNKKVIKFNTFTEMIEALPDDAACRAYLEQTIWKNGIPTCPHCGCIKSYVLTTEGMSKGWYKCADCLKKYNVCIGTMFEGSHISLRKWFIAIYIFSLHKKGISSHQLASDLGIRQASAWFLLSKMRNAFAPKKANRKKDGLFQVDETFIGGKNKNRHADKKVPESQGRSAKDKTPVFGIMQAGGKIHTTIIPDTKGKTMKPIIEKMAAKGAIIVSDDWKGYNGLSQNYKHIVVNHNEGEYVNGAFHTNSIENFWSLLKRGIYGIYHQVSSKHLYKYCNEFAFRYNERKTSVNDKFDYSLKNSSRLKYRELVA